MPKTIERFAGYLIDAFVLVVASFAALVVLGYIASVLVQICFALSRVR